MYVRPNAYIRPYTYTLPHLLYVYYLKRTCKRSSDLTRTYGLPIFCVTWPHTDPMSYIFPYTAFTTYTAYTTYKAFSLWKWSTVPCVTTTSQEKPLRIYPCPSATSHYLNTVLSISSCHTGYQPLTSARTRPPGESGPSSPPGSVSAQISPISVTWFQFYKYLRTGYALASWHQADTTFGSDMSRNIFTWWGRSFPQWYPLTHEWIRRETSIYGSNARSLNIRTRTPKPHASALPHYTSYLTCTSYAPKGPPFHCYITQLDLLAFFFLLQPVQSYWGGSDTRSTPFCLDDFTFSIIPRTFSAASANSDQLYCTNLIYLTFNDNNNYVKG